MPPPLDQGDLFGEAIRPEQTEGSASGPGTARASGHRPLAVRMRPRTLAEVVGQEHILRPGSLLPRLVAQNRFGSLIFYGPPGTGKTSIAEAIANETKSRFVRVYAVMSNVAELREILLIARPGILSTCCSSGIGIYAALRRTALTLARSSRGEKGLVT